MMHPLRWTAPIVLIAASSATAQSGDSGQVDRVAAGIGAKLGCSAHFVSGRALDGVISHDIEPLLPVLKGMRYSLDEAAGTLTVTHGAVSRSAAYRPGLGCTLLTTDGTRLARPALPALPRRQRTAPWPLGDRVTPGLGGGIDHPALDRAVAAMFAPRAHMARMSSRPAP
jgi:hypothetical protein